MLRPIKEYNSLRMMTAVEYGMLSNMWSIPQAKREVRYGLKKTAVILVSYYVVGIDCSEIRNVLRYTERSLMA